MASCTLLVSVVLYIIEKSFRCVHTSTYTVVLVRVYICASNHFSKFDLYGDKVVMENVVNLLKLDESEALRILTEPIASAGQSTVQQPTGASAATPAASAPSIALPVNAVVARLRPTPQLLHSVRLRALLRPSFPFRCISSFLCLMNAIVVVAGDLRVR